MAINRHGSGAISVLRCAAAVRCFHWL